MLTVDVSGIYYMFAYRVTLSKVITNGPIGSPFRESITQLVLVPNRNMELVEKELIESYGETRWDSQGVYIENIEYLGPTSLKIDFKR
jgi:hypothetical protein